MHRIVNFLILFAVSSWAAVAFSNVPSSELIVRPDLPTVSTGDPASWKKTFSVGKIVAQDYGSDIHFVQQNGRDIANIKEDPIPPLRTRIYGAKSFGVLDYEKVKDGAFPYIVVGGMACKGCQDRNFVYLISADGSRSARFTYPGKVRNRKNKRTLLESRSFYGNCLRKYSGDVYVVFQKEKLDRRKYLQHSVFIAEPHEEGIREKILVRGRPRLKNTLRRVRKKVCQEIKGVSRVSLKYLPEV